MDELASSVVRCWEQINGRCHIGKMDYGSLPVFLGISGDGGGGVGGIGTSGSSSNDSRPGVYVSREVSPVSPLSAISAGILGSSLNI